VTGSDPIPFGRPLLDESAIAAVADVLRSGMLVHGKVTHAFEARFAARVGSRHAVAVSSGTAALHLVLFARGIGPGRRVAVPAMTHVATAHAVELLGARPVFVDVAPESGNLDPIALAGLDDLAAVVVVHYLGLPCDMTRIGAVAARHGAFVLEDCALALDAGFAGAKAGTLGLAGCFSFYPAKHMTSIEGGMIVTDDADLAAATARARAFGYDRSFAERRKPGIYDVVALGFNYRMSEIDAAVGLSQLDRLDDFQARRADHYRRLRAALADVAEITIFAPRQGAAVSSHYCLNAVLPRDGRIDRDQVVAGLNAQGIGTSVHYPSAVPLFSYYREKYGYRPGEFPVAEWLADQTISLPVGPHLPPDGPERIAAAFKVALHAAAR
jgi:dTDP-4-amino-4,6-dideoxygalactose transaminase